MTFNLFLEGGHLVLRVILGLLDEVAQVNELFLVLGDLADALLHVVKGGRDVLDTVTAPLVDALDQLLLDTIGFLGQLDLKVSSLHLEDWEVDDVVGDVQDLVFGLVELVEFGGDFLEGGLSSVFSSVIGLLNRSLIRRLLSTLRMYSYFLY